MIQSDLPGETKRYVVTPSSSDNKNKWYKIGEVTINQECVDSNISFFVFSGFAGPLPVPNGILTIHIRRNTEESLLANNAAIQWLVTTYSNLTDFCLEIKDLTIELWVSTSQYQVYHFTVLAEGDRISTAKQWTLYTNPEAAEKPSTEQEYTEVTSTVAKLTTLT